MAGILTNIYPLLPTLGQNILVSGQGLLYKRARFGGAFTRNLEAVRADGRLSADEMAALQLSKLQEFVAYAFDHSPYYQQKYKQAGVSPNDLLSLDDLKYFPVLEKDELRRFTSEIQSRPTRHRRDLQWISTSGTTGSPINIAFTPEDMQLRFAYLYRMLNEFQIAPFDRSVRFSGKTIFDGAQNNGIFWRMNWPQNQMLMSSYHLKADNLDAYIDRLCHYNPQMLDGYPSAIFILAKHMNKTGRSGEVNPRLIVTTAETLESFQREEIKRAFPTTAIADQYASSEGAPFITQDSHGDMLVNIDTGVFEIDGDGDEGDMIVTSFTTHAFPLIRYRIGDRLKLSYGKVGRSMAMPLASKILGRQEDLIISPDRGPVGRLDPVFKQMPSTVIESQIEQVGPDSIILRIVPDYAAGFSENQISTVLDELKKRLGQMTVTIEMRKELARGANGKLRAIIGLPQSKL